MSRALGRLRDLLGDPLLVRAQGELALTPKAERLQAQLAVALDHTRQVFREPALDLREVKRVVRIAAADSQTVLFAPPLMHRLAREAPGIDIRFEPHGPDPLERLEQGVLDFAFAVATTPLPAGMASAEFQRDRLVLVMRRGHPRAESAWRIEDYGAVDHVGVAILGDNRSDLDGLLALHGVHRRIALVTPHFTAALAAVAATYMVTTISRAFAERFASAFDLALREPPIPQTELIATLVWSHRRAGDPLLAWLRGVLLELGAQSFARST
jgi:DNA-binding transcriptional LysR family regulator